MRSTLASRIRNRSISAVPPPQSSSDYSQDLARSARRILYRSPLPSQAGFTIFILNAAAFPDTHDVDYDALLPYVLARLPGEDELISGTEYEVVFFAGGGEGSATRKSGRPSWAWFIQAYNVLSRAMRKRIRRLYIVHEKSWVRVLVEMFSTIVSPKFRKKVVHVSTLSALALHLPIEELLIPPSAYLYDRRLAPDIHVPYVTGRRAFSARHPLPKSVDGRTRLPRVLRETTSFVLLPGNIKQEGIFRIPPHAKLNEVLREAYDRSQRFVIWKEGDEALPLPKAHSGEGVEKAIADVDQVDAYGVASATGLIKSWYRELRQPLFPQSSYPEIRRLFGDREAEIELSDLVAVTSPAAQVSPLPLTSRIVLTRHLLPLLARVEGHKDSNQMTAKNLAICFAPTLLCGPDQLEDMKLSSLVSRYLEAAIESWDHELREVCGLQSEDFEKDLQPPESFHEYEDPLDLQHSDPDDRIRENESQTEGIILIDNDEIVDAPPLPPRRTQPQQQSGATTQLLGSAVRRRPVPPLEVPPRYSRIEQDSIENSPTSYDTTADGFAPHPPSSSSYSSGNLMEKDVGNPLPEAALAAAKRKALPTDNSLSSICTDSEARLRSSTNTILRKPLAPAKSPSLPSASQHPPTAPPASTVPPKPITNPDTAAALMTTASNTLPIFAKPTWPASSTRSVSLPLAIVPNRKPPPRPGNPPESPVWASPTASMPTPPLPKPRTPSPGLLQRMPSFETAARPAPATPRPSGVSVKERVGSLGGGTAVEEQRPSPRRLEMRERSVDDLRRIYEERVGTVQGLVRMGSGKERKGSVRAESVESGAG
ncbi:MAG: hypothetical protein M1822_001413 [Bathelium mastoideum]|nr:MAG: hypothetical protein M1822_001413 [Bathelium mastoideum]